MEHSYPTLNGNERSCLGLQFSFPSITLIYMSNEYQSALKKARTDLADAKMQRDSLAMLIERLEAFIAHAEVLAGPRTAPLFENAHVPVPEPLPAPNSAQEPIWKALVTGLNGKKGRFTVPEGLAALDRIGRKINSKNRATIVRNAIKDKPSVFGKYSEGVYYVRGYEDHGAVDGNALESEGGAIEIVAVH